MASLWLLQMAKTSSGEVPAQGRSGAKLAARSQSGFSTGGTYGVYSEARQLILFGPQRAKEGACAPTATRFARTPATNQRRSGPVRYRQAPLRSGGLGTPAAASVTRFRAANAQRLGVFARLAQRNPQRSSGDCRLPVASLGSAPRPGVARPICDRTEAASRNARSETWPAPKGEVRQLANLAGVRERRWVRIRPS